MRNNVIHLVTTRIESSEPFYTEQDAREIARQLQEVEKDGWRFIACPRNGSFWAVAVYDEQGILTGYW